MLLRENEKFGMTPSQLDDRMDLMSFINNQALHDCESLGRKLHLR